MGNKSRCPMCNRFGTQELNGYCKDCFPETKATVIKDRFYLAIKNYNELSSRVVKAVCLEYGYRTVDEVKPEERKMFLDKLKKRIPNQRQGHIVRGSAPLTTYSRLYREGPKSLIKEKINLIR